MDQLRYYLAACLFLIATHSASASVTDALGEAGFSCFAATDGFGTSFGGTMCTHEAMSTSAFTLDEAIAVYVPSTTGVVVRRIVLYLQGFRGVCGDTGATPADVMNVFDLAEQMQADSPPDSVLVFPMSHGHDTTYYRDFAATGGPFAEFMNWIETIVGEAQWSLAGHSGAGDVIAKSLNLNPSTITKFDAIELLDAAYNIHHASGRFRSGSEAALWQTIAERNPSLILSCIGNGTYSGCQILAEQAGFVTVALTETHVDHCEIPNAYFGARVLFIFQQGCLNRAASARSAADRSDGPPITLTVARIFCAEGSACQAKTASCKVAQSVSLPAPSLSVAGCPAST